MTKFCTKNPLNRNGRTILTNVQKNLLQEVYEKNKFPSREEKNALASRTGLQIMVINTWFQNKRARSRFDTALMETNPFS